MADLFTASDLHKDAPHPLADSLRPDRLDAVLGQDHLVGPDGVLTRLLARGKMASLILWGPPGVGKTTIARLIANEIDLDYREISAVFSGVKDLRAVFDQAELSRARGQGTLLFVDEIHRFNRAQQDGFLNVVESGVITLIGATTENPSFELNGALLSRCQVLVLKRLDIAALEILMGRGEAHYGEPLPLQDEARAALLEMADGDGRFLLNLIEQIMLMGEREAWLDLDGLAQVLQRRAPAYDKDRDGHYNLISALHKSVRGSDPDAALYWFARMLEGGEDPLYLARRLIRMASEDIGLADPSALMIANEAAQAYERLGSPEGELALAQAVLHLATAPKSNAAYVAFKKARKLARQSGSLTPPKHILNAPTGLMKAEGYGAGYIYDPDTEEGFSGQSYFPEDLPRQSVYQPKGAGRERAILDRLTYWKTLRDQKETPE